MTANNPVKQLEVLVGDDELASPISWIEIRRCYFKLLQERLASYCEVKIKEASKPEQVIREAQTGKYDIIVTDLDYQTEGRVGTEGYKVLDAIADMTFAKKPLVILCTSSDSQQETIRRKLKEGKMDLYIGSRGMNHKFANLVNYLVERFGGETIK